MGVKRARELLTAVQELPEGHGLAASVPVGFSIPTVAFPEPDMAP